MANANNKDNGTENNETPETNVTKITSNVESTTTVQDSRMDKKVLVRSIAPWVTGSPRVTSSGDISIPPKGSVMLSREEIVAQAQNGNKLINGIDSLGSHATWFIEDDFTRSELSFDIPKEKKAQQFLTKDSIAKIFEYKTQKTFEDHIKEEVVTRAEKAYLMEMIKELKLNDYVKISFCVDYTGIRP